MKKPFTNLEGGIQPGYWLEIIVPDCGNFYHPPVSATCLDLDPEDVVCEEQACPSCGNAATKQMGHPLGEGSHPF